MSSTTKTQVKLSVGDKGRITLDSLAEGVSSFAVEKLTNGNLLLKPLVEIPAPEAWLFRDSKALTGVKRGLKDLEAGRLNDAPEDFSQYLDDHKNQEDYFSLEMLADILSLPKRSIQSKVSKGELQICPKTGLINKGQE